MSYNGVDMTAVLLVEDAKFYRSVIKSQLENQLGFEVVCAVTFAEADQILKEDASRFFLALLDVNLPDAPNGEIVDHVVNLGIPSIVFSGHFNEGIRDELMEKNIIDYVLKDSPASIEYVISTVRRLHLNQFIQVLVVDDSKSARYQMCSLLKRYKFQVLEAADGLDALKVLDENPEIKLIITDYNMPNLDGFELTKKIRTHSSKRELSIIGVSTYGNHALSAKFIKVGANDFLTKPFLNEEFFCRISQNVDMIEYIAALKDAVVSDALTGLNNRRYLFQRGEEMMKEMQAGTGYLSCAMLDIDHFRIINDTHGHELGDNVLKSVGAKIGYYFKNRGVVCRYGGEEFCVLLYQDATEEIAELFETIRQDFEKQTFDYKGTQVAVTLSIGVTWQRCDTLDELVNLSEMLMYEAKSTGRNRVVLR